MSIEDAFAQLQMMAVETQETLFVINVLRKKIMYQQKRNKKELARIKKDKLSRGEAFNAKDAEGFEVDLAKMGVVQHLILILQTCETVMDKVRTPHF